MKHLFIFFLFLLSGFGCVHQKSASHENPELVLRAEAEEWRASAPGMDELTEHGTDLTIELQNRFSGAQFIYMIYKGRKSFPVTVQTTGSGTVLVKARVLYESDLLAEPSGRSDLSDRLVFQQENGTYDFIPIQNWSRKPLSYR
jgi:hypothetical protein